MAFTFLGIFSYENRGSLRLLSLILEGFNGEHTVYLTGSCE